jgi:hypothetical protein
VNFILFYDLRFHFISENSNFIIHKTKYRTCSFLDRKYFREFLHPEIMTFKNYSIKFITQFVLDVPYNIDSNLFASWNNRCFHKTVFCYCSTIHMNKKGSQFIVNYVYSKGLWIKWKLRGDSRCFKWKLREENSWELRSSALLHIGPTL